MGLTDGRKTDKNLVDSRKNWKILTISRKKSKKRVNRKRNCSLDLLLTFKGRTKLTYGCVFYFPASVTLYAR